jgi:hypothetical protein
MASPVALPAAVVSVAGYLAVAGGVMSAVSQVTVDDAAKKAETGRNPLADNISVRNYGHRPDQDE